MHAKSLVVVFALFSAFLSAAPVAEGLSAYYNFDALVGTQKPFSVPRLFWDGAVLAQSETGTLTLIGNNNVYDNTIGARRWSGNCSLNGAWAGVYLAEPMPDFIPPATGSWTLAFWFGRDTNSSRPILLSNGAWTGTFTADAMARDDQADDRRGFAFYSLTDDRIGFRFFSQIGEEDATLGSLISTDTCTWGAAAGNVNIGWSHVAVVCEREETGEGTLTLYLNGIAQTTTTLPEGAAIVAPTGADWKKQFNSSSAASAAMGAENALDDIAMWSRALTATEIAFIGKSGSEPLTITASQTAILPKAYTRTLTGSGLTWSTPGAWTIDGTPNQDWVTSTTLDSVALTTADTAAEITVDTRSEIGSLAVTGSTPLTFKAGEATQNLTALSTTLGVNTTIEDGAIASLGRLTFTGSALTLSNPAIYSSFSLGSGQTLTLKGGSPLTALPAFNTLFANGGRLNIQKDVTLSGNLAAGANSQKLNVTVLGGTLTVNRIIGGNEQSSTTDIIVNGGTLKATNANKTFSVESSAGAVFLGNWNAACSFRLRAGRLLVEEGVVNLGRDSNLTFSFAADATDSAASEARLYGIGSGGEARTTTATATFGKGTVVIGKGGLSFPANHPNKKIVLSGPVTFTTYADADLPAAITGYTGWSMPASHANAFVTTASGDNAPTLDPKDKLIRITAVISGAGGLKIGSTTATGSVALDGPNTYTGLTRVLGGNLLINESGTPGGVTLDSGATLSGSGTITGPLTFSEGAVLKATKLDGNATTLTASGTITLPAEPVAVDITNFGAEGKTQLTWGDSVKLLGWATKPAGSFTLAGTPAQTGNLVLKKTDTGLNLERISGVIITIF